MTDLDALRRAEQHTIDALWKEAGWADDDDHIQDFFTAIVSAVERRVRAEAHEGMEDAFMIEGVIAKDNDKPLTEEESDAFTHAFLSWLIARGLMFSGAIGVIHKDPHDEAQ